jgi:hypothetical protein
MTANYLAQICESKLSSIFTSEDEKKSLYEYNRAIGMLETYMKGTFLDFVETELVYQHCQQVCESRNRFENWHRSKGFYIKDRLEALKVWDGLLYNRVKNRVLCFLK